MCGTEYCDTCSPTDPIVAWTCGESHTVPNFGDQAQRRVSFAKRSDLFWSRFANGDTSIMVWPEYESLFGAVPISEVRLAEVLENLALPSYIREPQKGWSAKQHQKREKALERWNAPFGGAYRAFRRRIRCLFEVDSGQINQLPIAA